LLIGAHVSVAGGVSRAFERASILHMIANIKTVAVYVSDQTAALRFYTEKLGFEVRRTESMGSDGTWVEVAPRGALS
jgi:hypothetical protein